MSARVTDLETTGQDRVHGSTGDDTEMTRFGYCASQSPIRNGHPHAALDQNWLLSFHGKHDWDAQTAKSFGETWSKTVWEREIGQAVAITAEYDLWVPSKTIGAA